MFLHLPVILLFVSAEGEFPSSDTSDDDDVPCLIDGDIQQEYGISAAPFYQPQC